MNTGKKYMAGAAAVLLTFVLLAGMLFGVQTNVRAAGQKVALSSTKITLKVGQSKKLTVSNAKKVTWKSTKPAVVSVNKNGKIKAKKAGKASIVAKALGKRLVCRVTVKKDDANGPSETTPTEPTGTNGKLLVAYFSWSGTSERIAQNIIAQTGADSFRIERETPYSTDYNEVAYGEARTEADTNARPPIKKAPASLAEYDRMILCYPIWWHTAPMTVGTFLESYDLSGKYIYPISQSASMDRGQYEQSVTFIRECAKGAVVDDGLFTKDADAIRAYVNGVISGVGKAAAGV